MIQDCWVYLSNVALTYGIDLSGCSPYEQFHLMLLFSFFVVVLLWFCCSVIYKFLLRV